MNFKFDRTMQTLVRLIYESAYSGGFRTDWKYNRTSKGFRFCAKVYFVTVELFRVYRAYDYSL